MFVKIVEESAVNWCLCRVLWPSGKTSTGELHNREERDNFLDQRKVCEWLRGDLLGGGGSWRVFLIDGRSWISGHVRWGSHEKMRDHKEITITERRLITARQNQQLTYWTTKLGVSHLDTGQPKVAHLCAGQVSRNRSEEKNWQKKFLRYSNSKSHTSTRLVGWPALVLSPLSLFSA